MPENSMRLFPESATPGCSGYFHIPPVWMVEEPTPAEIERGAARVLGREVLRTTIAHGIRVRVQRDGVVVFDCRSWKEAGETTIPGYQPVARQPIPRAVTVAEEEGETKAMLRAQLINAHQACLNAAHYAVHSRGQELGAMVISSQAFQLYDFEQPVGVRSDYEPVQRFVATMLDYRSAAVRRDPAFKNRRLVERDTLEHSLRLLDTLLLHSVKDLITVTDLLFRAGAQFAQSRFAESLVVSWAACERLLNEAWRRYLDERKAGPKGEPRITGDRKKKLLGRDFSASVISEALELAGVIPLDLFELISAARKSRNDWLHGLKPVVDRDAVTAMRAGQGLFQQVTGIRLHLSLTRVGGTGGCAPVELVRQWQQPKRP